MPTASTSMEADAIDAAYENQVRTLYLVLATNLGDTPASEKRSVGSFTRGLRTAQRARELALNVVGAEVPGSVARTDRKKVARK